MITFIQTSDVSKYRPLIDRSSLSLKAYCEEFGHAYECFYGIKRGAKPWHASLNRIPILKSYTQAGYDGWVVYVDADAYIADLSFDIGAYLAERSQYALIAAPSGLTPPRWWDINAGVFAINLGHDKARELVDLWFEKFMAPPLDVLSAEAVWGDVIDDQAILHEALNAVDGFEDVLLRDEGVFNWNARFIRQVVRDAAPMWLRIERIEQAVSQSLAAAGIDASGVPQASGGNREEANEEFVEAIYKVMFGRHPDPGGRLSSLAALRSGERTYRDDLNSCMESPEFKDRLPQLLKRILTEEERRALAAALA